MKFTAKSPLCRRARRVSSVVVLGIVLSAGLAFRAEAQQPDRSRDAYVLPPASVQELFDRDKNLTRLDRLSPDGDHFLIPLSNELSSLALMSQTTYRLAMLEFMPHVNREWRLSTDGIVGLDIYSLEQRRRWSIALPDDIFVSDVVWSPDGQRVAFLAHLPEGTQVWTADVASGDARRLSDAHVMATVAATRQFGAPSVPSRMLQWTPDGSVLALLVPADRGPEPERSDVPHGPSVRRSREKATPTRTLPFLLRSAHDAALFRYYTTAQLSELTAGQPPRPIGEPAMYRSVALSPDGQHILTERLVEPFSFIVGHTSFGRDLEVRNLDGTVVSVIRRVPLHESSDRNNRPEDDLPRDVAWRPDVAGLSLLWKTEEAEDEAADDERDDRLMVLDAPFAIDQARTLVSSDAGMSDVSYSEDGRYAFATLSGSGDPSRESIVAYDLTTDPPTAHTLVADVDPDDVIGQPGEIMTRQSGNGIGSTILSSDGGSAYLQGDGYNERFTPQPFIDRVTLATGATERVFEGSAEAFDVPLVPLDDDLNRLIVSREAKNTSPDSHLWTSEGGWNNLTENVDPYPAITAARRIDFDFTRRDGLVVQGRISLPVGYQPGTRVPAMFWTYPREYATAEDYEKAAMRSRNRNAYTALSFLRWSDIWLTQGYALAYPDIPILGKDGRFNDHFVSDASDTVYAAIRKLDEMGYVDVDRIGHGGHSYGAFTTANLLAHTPYFKAGIAGDGAYNRSLTPMAFQYERRFVWDAPTTYLEASPFFYADQINTPLLMYHGEQDNNSGTFLIQSERMMQALTGLGKTAVLYVYPFESHGPRTKENLLDLWAHWIDWFDEYVKSAGPDRTTTDSGQ